MSIITANIKLYSPFFNRFLLTNYALLIVIPLILVSGFGKIELTKALENNQYPFSPMFFFFLSIYLFGTVIGNIQLDVLTKPFSLCLPNQNKAAARNVFILGIVASLFYCLLFLLLPHPMGLKGALYFLSIPATAFFFYLLGAFLTFYIQERRQIGIFVFIVPIICLPILPLFLKLNHSIFTFDYFLFYCSIPLTIFVILMSYKVYGILVRPDLRRKFFLKEYILNIDDSKANKATELNETIIMKRLSGRVEKKSSMDKSYYKVLKKFSYLSLNRSIAGALYCMLDRYYTLNERYFRTSLSIMIILITLLLFLTGYINPIENLEGFPVFDIIRLLCVAIPCLVVGSSLVPPSHNQLLPLSRSDHFKRTLLSWLVKPLGTIVWVSLIILLTWIFQNHMPDFTLPDYHLRYHSLDSSLILWVLVIIPVWDTFLIYFENPCSAITMILVVLILIFLSLISLFAANVGFQALPMALTIILANGFFIERLARFWYRNDIILFI